MIRPKEDFPIWSITPKHLYLHDSMHYYVIDVITQALCLVVSIRGGFDKSGKWPHEMIPLSLWNNGEATYNNQHTVLKHESEQIKRYRTDKPTLRNSADLYTTWGAMGWLNTRCLTVYVLPGSAIGYLTTLVLVGLMHRLYKEFQFYSTDYQFSRERDLILVHNLVAFV